jgi:hypothetical protein
MIDRQAYIARLEEALDRWHNEIVKFKVIAEAEEEEPDAQIEYYQVIEEIAAKQDAIKDKLEQLKTAEETAANEQIKEEIESLRASLEEAIESARLTIN